MMPLVRLFAHKALTKAIPLPKLQARLCEIWGVKPQTTKLLLTRVDDWTSDQFDEDVYVSVRAKATPERTRDVVRRAIDAIVFRSSARQLMSGILSTSPRKSLTYALGKAVKSVASRAR